MILQDILQKQFIWYGDVQYVYDEQLFKLANRMANSRKEKERETQNIVGNRNKEGDEY